MRWKVACAHQKVSGLQGVIAVAVGQIALDVPMEVAHLHTGRVRHRPS